MKAMKECHRDFYDIHMLTTPINPRTGHSLRPSRQLCATWVVEVWDKVPEKYDKSWNVGNYKKFEDLQKENENA